MRGQVSMEFLYYIAIILIILAVVSYVSLSSSYDASVENNLREVRSIATTVAQEINTAVEIGDGYSHKFQMPLSLSSGNGYMINTTAMNVHVIWSDRIYSLPTLAPDVNGTVIAGQNTIRNSNGVIQFG